jgi:hypothetical protein
MPPGTDRCQRGRPARRKLRAPAAAGPLAGSPSSVRETAPEPAPGAVSALSAGHEPGGGRRRDGNLRQHGSQAGAAGLEAAATVVRRFPTAARRSPNRRRRSIRAGTSPLHPWAPGRRHLSRPAYNGLFPIEAASDCDGQCPADRWPGKVSAARGSLIPRQVCGRAARRRARASLQVCRRPGEHGWRARPREPRAARRLKESCARPRRGRPSPAATNANLRLLQPPSRFADARRAAGAGGRS